MEDVVSNAYKKIKKQQQKRALVLAQELRPRRGAQVLAEVILYLEAKASHDQTVISFRTEVKGKKVRDRRTGKERAGGLCGKLGVSPDKIDGCLRLLRRHDLIRFRGRKHMKASNHGRGGRIGPSLYDVQPLLDRLQVHAATPAAQPFFGKPVYESPEATEDRPLSFEEERRQHLEQMQALADQDLEWDGEIYIGDLDAAEQARADEQAAAAQEEEDREQELERQQQERELRSAREIAAEHRTQARYEDAADDELLQEAVAADLEELAVSEAELRAEAEAAEARERAEYMALEGPVLGVLGIPGFRHLAPEPTEDDLVTALDALERLEPGLVDGTPVPDQIQSAWNTLARAL